MSATLGVLEQRGLVSEAGLARARAAAGPSDRLVSVLTRLGLVSERDMLAAIGEATGVEAAPPGALAIDTALAERLSVVFLRRFLVLPLQGGALAMADPEDMYAREAMALAAGRPLRPVAAAATEIEAALDRLRGGAAGPVAAGAGGDAERLLDQASEAPVIRQVQQMLGRAVDAGASDLHVEPQAGRVCVRYRIDGVMREAEPVAPAMGEAILSRLKILARLDIAERRLPQDGRLSLSVRGAEVDFRLSTLPTVHGESAVVRVLDRGQVALDFAALGFDAPARGVMEGLLSLPHGMVLVTGPTGSGKTTTLYAALRRLNVPGRKLMTIEDPVEYQLAGVNQVQVQPQIGLTFAHALRAFLRQNPNVVMVGEIRDAETAQVAVQVALTGHLVLSTLHTNDAASAVTRLLDMGVEAYLIAATVRAVVGQRLVRTLCRACSVPDPAAEGQAARLGDAAVGPASFRAARGCELCGHTGFRGRTTLAEVLVLDEAVRRLVERRAPAAEMAAAAGMRPMLADGVAKARAGITTLGEVLGAVQAQA